MIGRFSVTEENKDRLASSSTGTVRIRPICTRDGETWTGYGHAVEYPSPLGGSP